MESTNREIGHRQIVRVSKLSDQPDIDDHIRNASIEERIGMMWQLAVDAWAMKGQHVAEQEFQRHVERIERRGR